MRTALLWIWFSSAYYGKERETSERKIEFGLLFWDLGDVQRNGHVLSDAPNPFDHRVCWHIMPLSRPLCRSVCLPACRPDDLRVYAMGFITGSCRRAPLTSRVFPSGDPAVEWRALPLGSTCAMVTAAGAGGGVGRVAITGPVKSVIACLDSRAWHHSPF